MNIQEIETITELGQWLAVHLPSAVLDERGGEIVILTGLSLSMGGYLNPIEEEEGNE